MATNRSVSPEGLFKLPVTTKAISMLVGNPEKAEGEPGCEPMIILGGWSRDNGNRRPLGPKLFLVLIQKQ